MEDGCVGMMATGLKTKSDILAISHPQRLVASKLLLAL